MSIDYEEIVICIIYILDILDEEMYIYTGKNLTKKLSSYRKNTILRLTIGYFKSKDYEDTILGALS